MNESLKRSHGNARLPLLKIRHTLFGKFLSYRKNLNYLKLSLVPSQPKFASAKEMAIHFASGLISLSCCDDYALCYVVVGALVAHCRKQFNFHFIRHCTRSIALPSSAVGERHFGFSTRPQFHPGLWATARMKDSFFLPSGRSVRKTWSEKKREATCTSRLACSRRWTSQKP